MTLDAADLLRWLQQVMSVVTVPFLIWITKSMLQVTQTIYGTKGDNGLNGDVRALREAKHEHAGHLQRHDGVLERHKERLDGHDREFGEWRSR